MRRLFAIFTLSMLVTAAGCSYAGATATDDDTVVVTKNRAFPFVPNQVWVCELNPEKPEKGLTNCHRQKSP